MYNLEKGVSMKTIKKFIFVSGPSESGKSSGVNHIIDTFSNVKHLKIRNIYRELYEKSGSSLAYDDWRRQEIDTDLEKHWRDYLELAATHSEGKNVIIMDTLYSTKDAAILYKILGSKLSLLYIDAPFQSRVLREYNRLRTDSPNTDRKADLTIKVDDVISKTKEKDAKKAADGMFNYPKLIIRSDNSISDNGAGRPLVYIINNTGTEIEFHGLLNTYIRTNILSKQRYNLKQDEKTRD